MDSFVTWLAPILSTLVICAGQLALNTSFKRADERKEKKQRDEEAWRKQVTERLDEQGGKIDVIMGAQCSQIRSDIIHKCHRYLDDLGCASTEEKQSLHAEYEDYRALCEASGTENHFVDTLLERAIDLPERDI